MLVAKGRGDTKCQHLPAGVVGWASLCFFSRKPSPFLLQEKESRVEGQGEEQKVFCAGWFRILIPGPSGKFLRLCAVA